MILYKVPVDSDTDEFSNLSTIIYIDQISQCHMIQQYLSPGLRSKLFNWLNIRNHRNSPLSL